MKKQMQKILFSTLIIALLSACGGRAYYLSPNFKAKASIHRTLAVLPFEVVTNGTVPEGMTESRKKQIEEQETLVFQQSLYNGLSNNLGRFALQIQLPNKTNNILRTKGIAITQVSRHNPEELAKILGVDAVVFATVTKHRYLDDKTSVALGAGKQALGLATGGKSDVYTSGLSTKTNDIKVTCSLVEARDGDVLWKINDDREADWDKPSNVVIDKLNQKLSENFPYKFLKSR